MNINLDHNKFYNLCKFRELCEQDGFIITGARFGEGIDEFEEFKIVKMELIDYTLSDLYDDLLFIITCNEGLCKNGDDLLINTIKQYFKNNGEVHINSSIMMGDVCHNDWKDKLYSNHIYDIKIEKRHCNVFWITFVVSD